jgi:hypothetical protein
MIRLEEIDAVSRKAFFGRVCLGTILREVDGQWVFYPMPDNGGFWSGHLLLALGEKLAFLNGEVPECPTE